MEDKNKAETKGNDFNPVHGNMAHVYGLDADADRAWKELLAEQEREHERNAIALERHHAKKLGVEAEFNKHVEEGRFREFMPYLNALKEIQELKIERKVFFAVGIFLGVVAYAFLTH